MYSVGVIEALRMQRNLKINAPFCTVCHVALPSSSQRCPLMKRQWTSSLFGIVLFFEVGDA